MNANQHTMKSFVLFIFLAVYLTGLGGIEHFSSRISGSEIAVNASFNVADDKYFDMLEDPSGWSSNYTNYNVSNKVIVGLNPSVKQLTTFNGEVELQVVYELWNATTLSFDQYTVNRTLYVEYNTDGNQQITDRSTWVLSGGHRMKIKIVGLTNVEEENIFIEGHVEVDRYYTYGGLGVANLKALPYPFSSSSTPFSEPNNEFIDIAWDFCPGAESYELEYVHINDYKLENGDYQSVNTIPFDYYRNSTRVDLLTNYYRIPNIYDHGYFIFRVRPVMRGGFDFSRKVYEEQWSAQESGMIGLHHPSGQIVYIGREYDAGMNWSHQAVFTEEGKRFESVSFGDGLGRGRQTVARNTATNQTVVSNVYFDELGRVVIADLPTPLDAAYPIHHPDFNRANVGGTPPFDNTYFDNPETSDGVCVFDQYGMSNNYGASKYYSPQNPYLYGTNGTIPNAENFPYSRIHYLNDFTGRVDRTSAAGPELALGKGHETQYYYVTATQTELYQLFGEEVGKATHYQKMVTVDANGQVYVQYTDMAGRVVASYMMGPPPTNLDVLEGTIAEELTIPIMVNGSGQMPDYENASATLTYTQYFAEDNESYDVSYSFTPQQYQSVCNVSPICFDCIYELELKIVEKCGAVLHTSSITFPGLELDQLCSTPENYLTEFTLDIPKGEYQFIKTLRVSQEAINTYWCMYIDNITPECLPPMSNLFNSLYDQETFPECDDDEYLTAYDNAEGCDLTKLLMAGDITPGGQYARYTENLGTYSASDPTSIFYGSTPPYTTFDFGTITVLDPVTSSMVSPAALSMKNYILLFDPSWANHLIENEPDAHPESCMLGFCSSNDASFIYDEGMRSIYTFTEAIDYNATTQIGGYFLPLDFASSPTTGSVAFYFGTNYANCDVHEDPFFATGGMGAAYASNMENRMDNYIDLGPTGSPCVRTIWEYSVLKAILDANPYIDISTYSCGQIGTLIRSTEDECLKDLIWVIYRKAYLELKQNYIYAAQAAYASTNCASMPVIGTGTGNYSGKWPHFPSIAFVNQVLNNATSSGGGGSIDFSDMSDAGDIQGVVDNYTEQACTTACVAYAEEWLQKLSGCNINPSHVAAIRADFEALCMSGCDAQHPVGASTDPTNSSHTIKNILASYGYAESILCTELLIDQPFPYGGNVAVMEQTLVPLDQCVCDKVLKAYYDLPGSEFTYPEEVLAAQTGVELDEIDYIACACNEIVDKAGTPWTPGYVWPSETNSVLASSQIKVIASLACPEAQGCTDCETVSGHLEALLDRFGFDAYPTLKENYTAFSAASTSYMVLTNYMNFRLKFLLEYDDYADFIGGCLATETEPYCEVNPQFKELSNIMKLLSFRGQLASATTVDLVQENIVYANSQLYEQGALGRYFQGSVTGNILTMSFSNGSSSLCEVELSLPVDATFGFEDIVSFGVILPKTTNCTNNNLFQVKVNYFSCGIIQTTFIEGTTDCFNVNLCACGDNGQILCNDTDSEPLTECYQPVLDELYTASLLAYQDLVNAQYDIFKQEYNAKCSQAFQTENYSYTGPARIYQYTLFYYDQAGNLVQTVAPLGVNKLIGYDAAITNAQDAVSGPDDNSVASIVPDHKHKTSYLYNSYDQLVVTTNPDQDGETKFWYDRYGRIVASQNPVQKLKSSYSYTFYDEVGRPYEVGQTKTATVLTEAIVKTDDLGTAFHNWANAGMQAEITKTFYDETIGSWTDALFAGGVQENLRLRVASVLYYDVEGALMTYVSATHYSYDLHGNVKEQIQDVPVLTPVQQDKKSTQYTYELISGNVKQVDYQRGKRDGISHAYHYDELNRLTEAETSIDNGANTDRQVHYRYYDYGPLARVEYGRNQVQGQDYAYTINGWMKGMNASVLAPSRDAGRDGTSGYLDYNQATHSLFAKDVTAYTLSYYQNDYKAINGSAFEIDYGTGAFNSDARNLYNGNIRSVVTSIVGMTTMGKAFHYDQLQRLTQMTAYNYDDNPGYSWQSVAATTDYFNSYSYDKNGNIRTLQRNGVSSTGLLMDNFDYKYAETLNGGFNNRLSWVDDLAGASLYADADIDNSMNAGNYTYDQIGQLLSDADEGIASIQWRLGDKKMKRMTRNDASGSELEFVYNPFGQRVLKIEKPRSGGVIQAQQEWKYTYYSYDANGQVMAVYDVKIGEIGGLASVSEHHLYGASRLGMIKQDKQMYPVSTAVPVVFLHTEGQTYYELSNYLGNVEAVVTDRKTWEGQIGEDVAFDQFSIPGDLLGWSFGDPSYVGNAPAVDYSITAPSGQLVVYAGSTIGSFGSALKQQFFENGVTYSLSFDITTSSPVLVVVGNSGGNVLTDAAMSSGSYTHTFTGNGQTLWYGFACTVNQTMQLDNIRLTKTTGHGYEAVVVKTADYYPYGMVMPGRHTESTDYRYAYNGMEQDNEIKGDGNSYTTEFRQYDPRLGRWLSLDPLVDDFPDMSPYCAFDNNPIYYQDALGEAAGPPRWVSWFSTILDFVPVVGQIKALAESSIGYSLDGTKLSNRDRLIALGSVVPVFALVSKAAKIINKSLKIVTNSKIIIKAKTYLKNATGRLKTDPSSVTHGNSLSSIKPNHVYEIYEKATGKVRKYGVGGELKDGVSKRAQSQLRQGENYRVVVKDIPRKEAINIERKLVSSKTAVYGQRLEGNLRPRPENWAVESTKILMSDMIVPTLLGGAIKNSPLIIGYSIEDMKLENGTFTWEEKRTYSDGSYECIPQSQSYEEWENDKTQKQ
jgi:RHS repeat-associated protein